MEEGRMTERVRINVWVGLMSSLVCWYGDHAYMDLGGGVRVG
jgi:hypothetical protein